MRTRDNFSMGPIHCRPPPRGSRCRRARYFVGSAVFHYLGPPFAVLLFARVDALGVAWLRIASAALSSPSGAGPGARWRRSTATGALVVAWEPCWRR